MPKNTLNHLIIILFLLIPTSILSQHKIDSLKSVLIGNMPDSSVCQAYVDLCWELKSSLPDSALYFGENGLIVARNIKNNTKEAFALKNIATVHLFLGNYNKSENYFKAAIKIFVKIKNDKGLAACYNNMGLLKELQGDLNTGMEFYKNSLEINNKIHNSAGIASCLTNIGNILQKQGNYRSSIDYYIKALKIQESLNSKIGCADAYNNIGALYEKLNAFENASENYSKALILYTEIDNKQKAALVLHNLGYLQSQQKNYTIALDYYQKALEKRIEYGDKQGIASTNTSIGAIYNQTGNLSQARKYYMNGQTIYHEIGNAHGTLQTTIGLAETDYKSAQYKNAISNLLPIIDDEKLLPEDLKQIYWLLGLSYYQQGAYRQAFDYQKKYIELKDSLVNSENSKNILQIQLDYEYQKKQKETELNHEKQTLHNYAELYKRKMVIIVLSVCLLAILSIAIINYRSYLFKKRDNIILEEQKNEIKDSNTKLLLYQEELISQKENLENQKNLIENQRNQLEEKNQRISDSIKYAKRIQNSMLPPDILFKNVFEDYFILFKPKAIVSGDFYWLRETREHIMIAVADCTGHGVPGAFMSLLGISFLNETVDAGITESAQILNHTREKIKRTLHVYSGPDEPKDGMDIGLCIIDKIKKSLQFSGAYHSLLIIQHNGMENNTLVEFNGDKMPIGSHLKQEKTFTTHLYQIQKDDKFILFTDGFVDQFGGTFDRKFLPSKFKEILVQTKELNMNEQKEILVQNLYDWMDNREQIDDILVIGFKISV